MSEHVEWVGVIEGAPRVEVITKRTRLVWWWPFTQEVTTRRVYERIGEEWVPVDTRAFSLGTRYRDRLDGDAYYDAEALMVMSGEASFIGDAVNAAAKAAGVR